MTTKALVVLIICWPIPLLHFWQLISHRHGCRWTPFFGWPLTIKYWLHFFTVVFFWLFIPNVFFTVGRFGSFFSQLVFLLGPKRPLLPSQLWERPQKIPLHTTMHCVPSACGFMENHCQDCCYLGYANIFCVCNLYDICHKIALKCVEATWTQILGNHFCCTKRVTLKLLSQLTRET